MNQIMYWFRVLNYLFLNKNLIKMTSILIFTHTGHEHCNLGIQAIIRQPEKRDILNNHHSMFEGSFFPNKCGFVLFRRW